MKKTLYDLTAEQAALIDRLNDLLEASYGEITPEVEGAMQDVWFAESDMADKLHTYGRVMDHLTAEAESDIAYAKVLQDKVDSLTQKAKGQKKVVDGLKARIKNAMEITGKTKVQAGDYEYAIINNGGALPLFVSEEEDPALYPELIKPPVFDNKLIRQAIADGEELTFAYLLPRGTRLRIK